MDDREARRDARRAENEAQREARRAERDARRAERDARRAERHAERASFGAFLGHTIRSGLHAQLRENFGPDFGRKIRDEIREGLGGAFDAHEGGTGVVADEVVERTFTVAGMPRVTIRNVSGDNEIAVGESGQVHVRARKRMSGWSEDRARRLLENIEIRMDQQGDSIDIEPRLFEQERGWIDLFRGGRVSVDLEIRVPRETQLDVTTVSGEVSVNGTRGPIELRTASGDVNVADVQGPLRVRSVSGDIEVARYAGQVDANSVSGDVRFEGSRVRAREVVTVSGDVDIDAVAASPDGAEARVKTVSGDVELSLADADVAVDFTTMSGDADAEGAARVEREGKRDQRIVFGRGSTRVRVKTVSGDLSCCAATDAPAPSMSAAADEAIAMAPPGTPETPPTPAGPSAREILERVARGELSVEDAAAALDAARGA